MATPPAPTKPSAPPAPTKPQSPPAPTTQEEKEPNHGSAENCQLVDRELWKRLRIFEAKLEKKELFMELVSCFRPPEISQEMHLSRIITWDEQKLVTVGITDKIEKAKKIKQNALNEFKKLKKMPNASPQKLESEAEHVKNQKGFKNNPVLPGVEPCPCGCNWPKSKHTYNPALAVDANVFRLRSWLESLGGIRSDKEPIVNSSTTEDSKNFKIIKKLTDESKLFWGINFTKIPADPIHFELK